MTIDEALAKHERRLAGEDLPYTRAEAQALIAYARRTIKERAGTRKQRSAANKAAWAAGDPDAVAERILYQLKRRLQRIRGRK
jgi:hypothetical protein